MLEIVEEDHLPVLARSPELPPRQPVADRDRQRQLAGAQPGARHADAPGDERSEHGEEPPRLARYRTAVAAVRRDRAESVQQRLAGHPDAVEPEATVVDAIEAALVPAVLDPHAGAGPPPLIPDRDQESVHSTAGAAGDQLGEDRGQASVAGGIADVVLARVIVGRVDDEFLALWVVGRRGPDRLHIGAVPGLSHGKAAGKGHGHGIAQITPVVLRRSEPADDPAEQPPLHSQLDQQRQVDQRQDLEGGKRATQVAFTAMLAREEKARASAPAHQPGLLQHPLAIGLHRQPVRRPEELRGLDLGAHLLPDRPPTSIQAGAESPATDSHLYHSLQH